MEVLKSNGERTNEPNLIQEELLKFFMLNWKDRQVLLENWPKFQREDMISELMKVNLEVEVTKL